MNFASTVLLAFAMSTDAFAAAIGKGACLHRPCLSQALRMGLIFGAIEAMTPVVGWGLGKAAAPYVTAWDHWIAFALLGGLGLFMIKNGWTAPQGEVSKRARYSFWILVVTALATSIDAMAVGVSLAFLDVDILLTALAIGFATMLMVSMGVMLGRVLSAAAGQRTEIAGGIILIGIGSLILAEHLGALA